MELKLQENKKKKHPLRYIALGAFFLLFVVYVVFALSNISSQERKLKAQLDALNSEIEIEEMANKELEEVLNYSDEEYLKYVLDKAHDDLGYIREGERVFEVVSGD